MGNLGKITLDLMVEIKEAKPICLIGLALSSIINILTIWILIKGH